MPRTILNTPDAPQPGGAYSQAAAAGGFVWTYGAGPIDPATGDIVGGADVGLQTRQVLRNISAILAAAGATLDDVVKVTTHLANVDRDIAAYDAVHGEYFQEPRPVRTSVGSTLPGGSSRGILVEIDVVAYTGKA